MKSPRSLNVALLGALAICAAAPWGASHAQDSYRRTRTVCEDVVVRDQPKDKHQIAGTAIGAVAGGLLGHQIGGGKGKTLATVGGAVAGGYAGNKVQEHQQEKNANTHVERRCHEEAY